MREVGQKAYDEYIEHEEGYLYLGHITNRNNVNFIMPHKQAWGEGGFASGKECFELDFFPYTYIDRHD